MNWADVRRRWLRWIKYSAEGLELLLVHPDDWQLMRCPEEFEGLPVKPLGIDIEQGEQTSGL